jgi:hypothetical protein
MSNTVDKIIAISRDTSVSAQTENGISWQQEDQQDYVWRGIAGSQGKYTYFTCDRYNPFATVNYTNNNYTTWVGGVLPAPQLSCIMAVARDAQNITVSYDGSSFMDVAPPVFSNSTVYGGNKIVQNCQATSTSFSQSFTAVNVKLFFVIGTAVSHVYSWSQELKCRVVDLTTISFTNAKTITNSIFSRTYSVVASSVSTFLGAFRW